MDTEQKPPTHPEQPNDAEAKKIELVNKLLDKGMLTPQHKNFMDVLYTLVDGPGFFVLGILGSYCLYEYITRRRYHPPPCPQCGFNNATMRRKQWFGNNKSDGQSQKV